ncbi:MAG: hypothetical protein EOP62_18810 [Sphingomonadales bacterium]|nr:MAG: hypothetical protein EOP62_18810 [Sphingomonadales bacterium]
MIATLFAAILLPVPMAQDVPQAPPQRVRSILLYGQEECPKPANEDEIVVCANVGESPYRIPKSLRDKPDESAPAQAWTNRVETVEEVNRAGLPNSCSPIGTGGQTGCTRQAIRQWYQERLNLRAKNARVPGNGN